MTETIVSPAQVVDAVKTLAKAVDALDDAEPDDDRYRNPVELRAAQVVDVKPSQRLVTVLAVPYEREAIVLDRDGRVVAETIERGAFGNIARRRGRVAVNRDHDPGRLAGVAKALHPNGQDGLIAELRMARTPLGDETLSLCEDDMLGASIGFAPMLGGEQYDRSRSKRTISKAYLDHVALVPDPAYSDAKVLDVRASGLAVVTSATPILDRVLAQRLADGVNLSAE